MGFLDRFKKQEKKATTVAPDIRTPQKRNDNQIEYSSTEDGRLVVQLMENNPKLGQFYDTTKLIIDNKKVELEGNYLQNCMVSWYGQNDCVRLDSRGNEYGRRSQFKNVLAEIDEDLLWTDENYCLAVMKMLLNQNRVEEYLNRGLQETPDTPCGKYVGGIRQREDGSYGKVFKTNVGKASHNSQEMVAKRQRLQEQIRQRQEQVKADKRAEIARLQQELDDMDAR